MPILNQIVSQVPFLNTQVRPMAPQFRLPPGINPNASSPMGFVTPPPHGQDKIGRLDDPELDKGPDAGHNLLDQAMQRLGIHGPGGVGVGGVKPTDPGKVGGVPGAGIPGATPGAPASPTGLMSSITNAFNSGAGGGMDMAKLLSMFSSMAGAGI